VLKLEFMKVRLISGELKGRALDVPRKFSAHPMGERIRSALFNSLTGSLEGATVLDAFGGSGACGLEALSRGASSVLILEKERSVFRTLLKNLRNIKLDEDTRIHISKAPASNYLKANRDLTFDVIICDPPYDLAERVKKDEESQLINTLDLIATRLNKKGTLILSWPERVELPELKNLKLSKEKTYAGAKLGWYS
jgi:16S rRNA (guanine966-N2)-methyltransferase